MSGNISATNNLDDPFIRVPREADDVNLDPYEFRVYTRLIRRAGDKGVAWQSVANMAEECRLSARKLHDALRELERRHMITGHRRPGLTTEYTINNVRSWTVKPKKKKEKQKATSAPGADPPLHPVQTTSAPGADKGEPSKENPRKEASPSSQVDSALQNPDSAEARAFLTMNGHSVDKSPAWRLRAFLLSRLGEHEFNHKQIQDRLTAWAEIHSLADADAAWRLAAERYKLERASGNHSGKRRLFWFIDILNGNYAPHATELNTSREQAAAKHAANEAHNLYQRKVRLPDGTTGIVASHVQSTNEIVLVGEDATRLVSSVEVIT